MKQVKEDKERLTDHYMQSLPPLLEKYGVDSDKLNNLLCIPQYFDLERYTSSRQEGVSIPLCCTCVFCFLQVQAGKNI